MSRARRRGAGSGDATDAGRRRLLAAGAAAAAAGWAGLSWPSPALAAMRPARIAPAAAGSVRLQPSLFADAVAATRGYLLRLDPGRLLHNFHAQAGLPPKGPAYGGWEGDTIAGHTLGHYLSALALMHAGNGDAECRARADAIVDELHACQRAGGDGYVAGFTRRRDDGTLDGGRAVLDEIARGHLEVQPFRLNGSWAPFYTWHKLFAGLLDAHRHCGNGQALAVAVDLADYLERKLAPLDHAQMQRLLECEFGGMPESLAELGARTGQARWIALARRFRHEAVLAPLSAGEDRLQHLHANTQIPKLLGEARLYEIEGRREQAAAALFFWERVTGHHSYAIGGNSDREYFQAPDTLSRYVTEQTCEHCNTLNMLRLSRRLHGWHGDSRYFDYYERALYNHVLSQQHPDGGRYTYMTPMQTGEARRYSQPEGEFWCCVGTGMESHAQFSDAIFGHEDADLLVNLYIPCRYDDPVRGLALRMASSLPAAGRAEITLDRAGAGALRTLRLRVPDWAAQMRIALNGRVLEARHAGGYALLDHAWRAGDRVEIEWAMPIQVEPCADDPTLVSLRRGPCVLAADLGPADAPWDGVEPWLPAGIEAALAPAQDGRLAVALPTHPHGLAFAPFHALHDRRHAVYFRRFDAQQRARWEAAQAQADARDAALQHRSLDRVVLGEEASERAHALAIHGSSYAVVYRRVHGRDARSGGAFEFTLRADRPAAALRLRYWGREHRRRFTLSANGTAIAHETLDGERGDDFVTVDYPLPEALRPPPREGWRFRIEPDAGYSAGPVFGAWLLGG
ncbi:beta-L-arabinofuranosidase domain-containing protein [Pseudoxanthomonas mexicana]|uniref:beta-L-arabinofuranosidase domain-containing protein n=1 Tax=Pseudoxanthomonas mexicana TaxID=128785 RepID=UPI00398A7121